MDWFQLSLYVQGGFCAQAFIVWIVTDQNLALGFPKMGALTPPSETYFIASVAFSWSNLILCPFFSDKAAIPQLLDCFRGSQTSCSLGVPCMAPPCLRVALCWHSWACSCVGNWSNWKITPHKNAVQLPQNVKPQLRVLLEEVDGLSWKPLDAGSILNPVRTPGVNLWAVCCWIPQDRWVFLPNSCVLVLKEAHVPPVAGVYFLFRGWFP